MVPFRPWTTPPHDSAGKEKKDKIILRFEKIDGQYTHTISTSTAFNYVFIRCGILPFIPALHTPDFKDTDSVIFSL